MVFFHRLISGGYLQQPFSQGVCLSRRFPQETDFPQASRNRRQSLITSSHWLTSLKIKRLLVIQVVCRMNHHALQCVMWYAGIRCGRNSGSWCFDASKVLCIKREHVSEIIWLLGCNDGLVSDWRGERRVWAKRAPERLPLLPCTRTCTRGKFANLVFLSFYTYVLVYCETQPPASIGWVALSSLIVCPAL